MPVVLAPECSVALTTVPTALRHRPEAKVLWLDAHGDFNTPETRPSGYLGGMSLAGACGRWDAGLGRRGRWTPSGWCWPGCATSTSPSAWRWSAATPR